MSATRLREWLLLPVLASVMICDPGSGADLEPHLVVFPYDSESTYTILAIPGVPTDIQLASGEKVTGLALGDTLQWMVETLPGHVFIKPIKSGLFTAGTLVTDQRVYQLVLRSTTAQGHWMQKVSWQAPAAPPPPSVGGGGALPPPLAPSTRNCAYSIEGEADFRPLSVCDDGRFTWIQMGSPQALPALFRVDEQEAVLVNYLIQNGYFVVQRLMPEILLKLGNAEVRITRIKPL